jgi:hypothetical protein
MYRCRSLLPFAAAFKQPVCGALRRVAGDIKRRYSILHRILHRILRRLAPPADAHGSKDSSAYDFGNGKILVRVKELETIINERRLIKSFFNRSNPMIGTVIFACHEG